MSVRNVEHAMSTCTFAVVIVWIREQLTIQSCGIAEVAVSNTTEWYQRSLTPPRHVHLIQPARTSSTLHTNRTCSIHLTWSINWKWTAISIIESYLSDACTSLVIASTCAWLSSSLSNVTSNARWWALHVIITRWNTTLHICQCGCVLNQTVQVLDQPNAAGTTLLLRACLEIVAVTTKQTLIQKQITPTNVANWVGSDITSSRNTKRINTVFVHRTGAGQLHETQSLLHHSRYSMFWSLQNNRTGNKRCW